MQGTRSKRLTKITVVDSMRHRFQPSAHSTNITTSYCILDTRTPTILRIGDCKPCFLEKKYRKGLKDFEPLWTPNALRLQDARAGFSTKFQVCMYNKEGTDEKQERLANPLPHAAPWKSWG